MPTLAQRGHDPFSPLLLRARVVVPVSQPPIQDGAVLVAGAGIRAVGGWQDLASRHRSAQVLDLGDSLLLPGLVNAHCHLDYTDMAGQIAPTKSFTDWVKSITTLKAQWTAGDFANSWQRGARMLLRSGTTTVADVEAAPELLPEMWNQTPLQVWSFLEMTGVKSRRDPSQILNEAIAKVQSLPPGRGGAGLSPHAPYSTTPELLRRSREAAARHEWRLTTHVAESAEEFEMFQHASGPMYEWLKRNERDMSDCGKGSPVQYLACLGFLNPNLIAVHLNHLAHGDADLLGRAGVNVVHCPRSHAYFRHQAFPLPTLTAAGVNICLGTDSLATVWKSRGQQIELDLFAEMQALAAVEPGLAPETILRMATCNGAQALGQRGSIGELSPNARANLIAIPFTGPIEAVYEGIVHHRGPVAQTMIEGKWEEMRNEE